MNRMANTAMAAAIVLSGWSAPARAQSEHAWRFSVTPYMWMAGLEGRSGVGPVAADVDLGFLDILESLKFAAMAYGEARTGRYVFGLDAMYISVSDGKVIAVRGDTGSLRLSERQTMVQPTAGIAFGNEYYGVDVLAGARYWNLSADLDVDPARRPAATRSGSRSWVDATGGVRLHWSAFDRVRFLAAGDGGGGGSDGTWQVYGSVGANVWSRGTLSLMYRYLSVDYDHDRFLYDTETKGFMLALTFWP